ncbi:helix-turn-helix domain-containing protein [Oerskovia turbata]
MVRNEEMPKMGAFAKAVASAVKASVDDAGVSGSALARHLDRAQSYASTRLNGHKAWTLDELDQIASLIDVSVEEILERARAAK